MESFDLCKKWARSIRGKKCKAVVKKVERNLSRKAVLMSKMVSFRKVHGGGGGGGAEGFDEDGGAIWKKTIIRGEKCRPLSFSGRILYDSDGNLLPE
ncbi:hypothetical protein MIMGU_mgv1a022841mg [Erythranthe guttata]|uniref:Uncharacterized protein n=1 Tax=Erythranthe guttata TaxID=4155 RepID=A0A022RX84_ERYGU|nr:hypothetical protein MIMGU_mgv1a022841mg [Erythranthe guttata]